QIPAAPIGFMTTCRVGEWHEQSTGVAFDPEGGQQQSLLPELEFELANTFERHFTSGVGLLVRRPEARLDARQGIVRPVPQASEVRPLGSRDRALWVLAKQGVLLGSEPGQRVGIVGPAAQ